MENLSFELVQYILSSSLDAKDVGSCLCSSTIFHCSNKFCLEKWEKCNKSLEYFVESNTIDEYFDICKWKNKMFGIEDSSLKNLLELFEKLSKEKDQQAVIIWNYIVDNLDSYGFCPLNDKLVESNMEQTRNGENIYLRVTFSSPMDKDNYVILLPSPVQLNPSVVYGSIPIVIFASLPEHRKKSIFRTMVYGSIYHNKIYIELQNKNNYVIENAIINDNGEIYAKLKKVV